MRCTAFDVWLLPACRAATGWPWRWIAWRFGIWVPRWASLGAPTLSRRIPAHCWRHSGCHLRDTLIRKW